ncbi:universal stress protein [Corynebacterium vitaeruminis]|uniref:UspA domain-containing protein n=1 Tax=Corynebacterium vitaeruminis DSM 20294 TaxID=1224164 RepID=W5Y4M6_9CORY|nr:universal stress protein [Corynebacterium vitaeruminis]AHI23815.1 hypothetical protein B843_12195 [Corynebacterium vitaeruminis DSM 20294]
MTDTNHPILVGYLANEQGRSAVALGSALARSLGAPLEIVMVTGRYPTPIVERQMSTWLGDALALVPTGVTAQARLVEGRPSAKALADTAQDLGCQLIVVGSAESSLLTRMLAGSVSQALLAGSPVPVAVAPLRFSDSGPVSRITCMYDPQHGDFQLFRYALERAIEMGVELRVVTLDVGDDIKGSPGAHPDAANSLRRLGIDVDGLVRGGHLSFLKATGQNTPRAIAELTWREGEVTMIGSTREAADGRVSAGPFATKLISYIPTPIVMATAGQLVLPGTR